MRGVWSLAVGCALTVQFACGLETIELRARNGERAASDGNAGANGNSPALPVNPGASPSDAPSAEGLGAPPLLPGGGFDGDGLASAPPAGKGCKKVDFLFVIDNSLSMAFAQDNLRESFAGFLRVIREQVDADDFHIMVVDTDAWEDDDERDDGGDPCRSVLGAGRRTNGSSGEDCGLPGDDRFVTLDQPDLEETFACMASVGTFGDNDEQPIDALLAANSRIASAPQGCNAGFAREDAVLVLTLITNADDEARLDEPPDWVEALLAQKGSARDPVNAQNAVVVLGLLSDGTLPPSSGGGFDLSTLACRFLDSLRLRQFVQGLDHGQLASVCSGDYAPFFAQAVQRIDTACT